MPEKELKCLFSFTESGLKEKIIIVKTGLPHGNIPEDLFARNIENTIANHALEIRLN